MEKKTFVAYFLPIFLTASTLCSSCSQKEPIEAARFDKSRWQTDKLGCNGERGQMLSDLDAIKNDLIGLSFKEVQKVLGKPDKVELYRRSQRFFIYYYEKGVQCDEVERGLEGKSFYVRFNTLDQVSEISLHLPDGE